MRLLSGVIHHLPTLLPALLPAMMLSACARGGEDRAANDPAAPTNRTVFAGNMYADRHVVRPVARAYAANIPKGARNGVHHFVSNLHEPTIFVNDVLQGNFGRSWNTMQRFAVNTTVGAIGIFDVAQGWGLPRHDADFGQTLGVWGVGTGPDVQLPLLGFSNLRDAAGSGIGLAANPMTLVSGTLVSILKGTSSGLGIVDGRANTLAATDRVEHDALDRYATLRSMTAQRRAAFVQEGREGRVHPVRQVASGTHAAVVEARS